MSTDLERVHPPKIMFKVADPLMRFAVARLGLRPPGLGLLRFTGRRSGRRLELLVAIHDIDGPAVLTNSSWRHNFEGGREVSVVTDRDERPMVGTLESDPEAVADAYLRRISEIGIDQAPRRLGIRSVTGEVPARDDLVSFVDEVGLSIIRLSPVA